MNGNFNKEKPWRKWHSLAGIVSTAMLAAVLMLCGCTSSRSNGGYGWQTSDEVLPTEDEALVRKAADAARAAKEMASEAQASEGQEAVVAEQVAETAQEAAPAVQDAAEKKALVVAEVPATPAAPAYSPVALNSVPQSEIPEAESQQIAVRQSSLETLAALAGDADDDASAFTDDEKVSRANKFDPLIGQGYKLIVIVRVGDRDEVGPIQVMVNEKGEISLPLIGRIHCEGLTINALHSRLSGVYGEYYTDPDVEVQFAYSDDGISPYGQVLVQGRVMHEGWVNIPPTRNLRLSHAIQRSGGFASSALRRKVLVLRKGDNGKLVRHVIDFKAIGKNGELDNDILLEPNDVIYVDESSF